MADKDKQYKYRQEIQQVRSGAPSLHLYWTLRMAIINKCWELQLVPRCVFMVCRTGCAWLGPTDRWMGWTYDRR